VSTVKVNSSKKDMVKFSQVQQDDN